MRVQEGLEHLGLFALVPEVMSDLITMGIAMFTRLILFISSAHLMHCFCVLHLFAQSDVTHEDAALARGNIRVVLLNSGTNAAF